MTDEEKARKLGKLWYEAILKEVQNLKEDRWSYIKDGKRYWFKSFKGKPITDEVLAAFVMSLLSSECVGPIGSSFEKYFRAGELEKGVPIMDEDSDSYYMNPYTEDQLFRISDLVEKHICPLIESNINIKIDMAVILYIRQGRLLEDLDI